MEVPIPGLLPLATAAAGAAAASDASAGLPAPIIGGVGDEGGWPEAVAGLASGGRHYRACLTCRISKIKCDGCFPCGVRASSYGAEAARSGFTRGVRFHVTGRARHASHTHPQQRCFRLSQPCRPQFWRKDPHVGLRGTELVFKTVDPRVR